MLVSLTLFSIMHLYIQLCMWRYFLLVGYVLNLYLCPILLPIGKDMPFQGLGRDAEKGLNDALRPLMYDHDEASDIVHPDSVPLTSVTTGAAARSLSFSDKASESYDTTSSSVLADLEPRSVQNPLTSTTHSAAHSTNNTLTQRTHSAAHGQKGEYGFSRNPSRSTSRLASVDRMGNMSKEEWQVLPNDMYALKDNTLTKAELTARTPWGVFATDHVSLTLMYCCFSMVRKSTFLVYTCTQCCDYKIL